MLEFIELVISYFFAVAAPVVGVQGKGDNNLLIYLRERSLTMGGGRSVLFQRLEPKNVSPSQVNSPKILAPFKM